MKIKKIKDIKVLSGKRVFLRVDFNLPVPGTGQITDESRVFASLPTVEYLIKNGAVVVLATHWGRPRGWEKSWSLRPIVELLEKKYNLQIIFLPFSGNEKKYLEKARRTVEKAKGGEVLLLDNVRFFAGEEENDDELTERLAELADIFVLDGFSVAHRSGSTVTGLAERLPSYAGFLLEKEIEGLKKIWSGKKPLVLIAGGLKIETKLPLIQKSLPLADAVLVGGEIFNTYLLAIGEKIGCSKVNPQFMSKVKHLFSSKKIIKPIDLVVGEKSGRRSRVAMAKKLDLSDQEAVLDIGPATIGVYAKHVKTARTLVWNGAMGYFEQPQYSTGTLSIARLLAARARGKAYGVAGGGETILALKKVQMMEYVDFVSTGGGAMLEYLSSGDLPGMRALRGESQKVVI